MRRALLKSRAVLVRRGLTTFSGILETKKAYRIGKPVLKTLAQVTGFE
jgi:hypothetical protein